MCGARLVELLLERGAAHVIAFDLAPPDEALQERFNALDQSKLTILSGPEGDLTSPEAVEKAFTILDQPLDVVYHIGALVGPFYDRDKYHEVNHYATIRIIDLCKKYKVRKLVYSSSPSTRFTGADVTGQREDELPMPNKWLAMYAEAKAYGEMAVSKAHSQELLTVSVAPHQVYGKHDKLFMPSLLETAGNERLRIFGNGQNKISVCHVDNYSHGLLCGADALQSHDSVCGGKFYIVTDDHDVLFWDFINQAIVAMGFTDLTTKFHLPVWLLYVAAYIANVVGFLTNRKLKLNPFNVKMLTIHRYFCIDNAKKDLQYQPIVEHEQGWEETIEWFKVNWLPTYYEKYGKEMPGHEKEE